MILRVMRCCVGALFLTTRQNVRQHKSVRKLANRRSLARAQRLPPSLWTGGKIWHGKLCLRRSPHMLPHRVLESRPRTSGPQQPINTPIPPKAYDQFPTCFLVERMSTATNNPPRSGLPKRPQGSPVANRVWPWAHRRPVPRATLGPVRRAPLPWTPSAQIPAGTCTSKADSRSWQRQQARSLRDQHRPRLDYRNGRQGRSAKH